MTDWRLQGQNRFLQGVPLTRKRYQKYRDDWDHDHCEFCGAKFSERPEDLHAGYVTTDNDRWVCDVCFKDFNPTFQWTVLPSENIAAANDYEASKMHGSQKRPATSAPNQLGGLGLPLTKRALLFSCAGALISMAIGALASDLADRFGFLGVASLLVHSRGFFAGLGAAGGFLVYRTLEDKRHASQTKQSDA